MPILCLSDIQFRRTAAPPLIVLVKVMMLGQLLVTAAPGGVHNHDGEVCQCKIITLEAAAIATIAAIAAAAVAALLLLLLSLSKYNIVVCHVRKVICCRYCCCC